MFIDNSSFELAEVQAACPDAMVFNAEKYLEIPGIALLPGARNR